MASSSIKNLLFDFGGVIVDLDREQAVRKLEALGFADAEKELNPYQQNGLSLDLESGKISASDYCRKLSEKVGHPLPEEAIADAWKAFICNVPLYKLEELKRLRKDFQVLILSNTNPFVLEWIKSKDFTPQGQSIFEFADKLYASCDLGVCKPDRMIFDHVIRDSGIRPEETLFLDDGMKNIEAAKALGFKTYCPQNKEDWRPALNAILASSKIS